MKIGVLLTSYNRPQLVAMTLASLRAQSYEDWRCVVVDDDSDKPTQVALAVQRAAAEDKISIEWEGGETPEERRATVRYSINIIRYRHLLNGCDILLHACDNVEYMPDCFAHVVDFFDANPGAKAGYVRHRRDIWRDGGSDGPLSDVGHPECIPNPPGRIVSAPLYTLDHSQVFFRQPARLNWPTDIRYRKHGDGIAFTKWVREHGPIMPIPPFNTALSVEHYDNLH